MKELLIELSYNIRSYVLLLFRGMALQRLGHVPLLFLYITFLLAYFEWLRWRKWTTLSLSSHNKSGISFHLFVVPLLLDRVMRGGNNDGKWLDKHLICICANVIQIKVQMSRKCAKMTCKCDRSYNIKDDEKLSPGYNW